MSRPTSKSSSSPGAADQDGGSIKDLPLSTRRALSRGQPSLRTLANMADIEAEVMRDKRRGGLAHSKQQRKHNIETQKELFNQRVLIAHLRADNDRMRSLLREVHANDSGQRRNEIEKQKRTDELNALVGTKFALEEMIEKKLEELELVRRKKKDISRQMHALVMQGREHDTERGQLRDISRYEVKIAHFDMRHSETVAHNKGLRVLIDSLRMDRLNANKTKAGLEDHVEEVNAALVQLVNITNDFYTERQHIRVMSSMLLTEAGREAEEFRASVQELANRSEYFEQLMAEREEDFKKALQKAELQASNEQTATEEARELEKKKLQEMIEAFDKIMHSFSVWDVMDLVDRFLNKEEKFFLQYRYLDALNRDAERMKDKIELLNEGAKQLAHHVPAEDSDVLALKAAIQESESKSDYYQQRMREDVQLLVQVSRVLNAISLKMRKSQLLKEFRPAMRRWALVRANLKLIRGMSRKNDNIIASKIAEPIRLITTGQNRFDPRHKAIEEEVADLEEIAPLALSVVTDLTVLESATLRLIAAKKLVVQSQNHGERRKIPLRLNQALALRALNYARTGVGNVAQTNAFLSGPKYSVQSTSGRADMLVIPTLKDIDSPRDEDGAMSSREIVQVVQDRGFSDKVADKVKKAIISRMPVPPQKGFGQKTGNIAQVALEALRLAKARRVSASGTGDKPAPRRKSMVKTFRKSGGSSPGNSALALDEGAKSMKGHMTFRRKSMSGQAATSSMKAETTAKRKPSISIDSSVAGASFDSDPSGQGAEALLAHLDPPQERKKNIFDIAVEGRLVQPPHPSPDAAAAPLPFAAAAVTEI